MNKVNRSTECTKAKSLLHSLTGIIQKLRWKLHSINYNLHILRGLVSCIGLRKLKHVPNCRNLNFKEITRYPGL